MQVRIVETTRVKFIHDRYEQSLPVPAWKEVQARSVREPIATKALASKALGGIGRRMRTRRRYCIEVATVSSARRTDSFRKRRTRRAHPRKFSAKMLRCPELKHALVYPFVVKKFAIPPPAGQRSRSRFRYSRFRYHDSPRSGIMMMRRHVLRSRCTSIRRRCDHHGARNLISTVRHRASITVSRMTAS
jgi:hypothetical protein